MPSTMHQFEGEQIGSRMKAAIALCENSVWASRNQLAMAVGPNGSQRYGYEIVNRCIRKGLLRTDEEHEMATPQSTGAVEITEKGERFLRSI